MLWMKPCLTPDLLGEFRDLWRRYTAPSDDRASTRMRELSRAEATTAIASIVSLANKVAIATATRRGEQLATLADLT